MTKGDERAKQRELEQCQAVISGKLGGLFTSDNMSSAKLLESMRYSLLAGGKRIRPVICIKLCEAAGGDPATALDAACAIEMIHTYSLIHDDLPCMDNSDMRRGKPSNHKHFGEFTATLAGDALQTAAFDMILSSDLPPDTILKAARVLAEAAGPYGICGGQHLDVHGVWKLLTEAELIRIHNMKTASLISAAARIGVIIAGGTQEQIKAADEYAMAVGLAFQVRDDVLDITEPTENLGKPMGADLENNKITFAMIAGVAKCEEIIRDETKKAVAALKGKFDNTEFLVWLAHMLAERRN